jgi:GNAT superfamily N-acetyltransferase
METQEIKAYASFKLLNIACDKPFAWDEADCSHIRVCMPANLEHERAMQERGFFLADRLLDVSLNLKKNTMDFDSLVRIKPSLTAGKREAIRSIACHSFPRDRRFHVGIEYNDEIAHTIISDWVAGLTEYYVCEYKEQVIGFLALQGIEGGAFVYLAAVEEKYRLTGAALSLYAYVAGECKKRGYTVLNGRISTLNIPVINLYSFLGAGFSNPTDVFLKEVK